MSNFETGASCASENAAGNVDDQCSGVLSMDTSSHNKFEPPKGDGHPLLDGVGQHCSGRGNANGQNGNDSSKATDGSCNRQQGIGTSSKATSDAHANAANTHEANARDHGPKELNDVLCRPFEIGRRIYRGKKAKNLRSAQNFPQGHAEHTLTTVDFGGLLRIPTMILCRVVVVQYLGNCMKQSHCWKA